MVALVEARRATLREINEMMLDVEDGEATEKDLSALREKAKAQYGQLRNKLGAAQSGTSCGIAYVTFENASDATAAQKTWGHGPLERLFMCLACRPPVPRFKGRLLQVERAAEASDVKWGHLSYQGALCGAGPFLRQWTTNVLTLMLLVPCAWLVLVLTTYKLELHAELADAHGGGAPAPPSLPPVPAAWVSSNVEQLKGLVCLALDQLLATAQVGGIYGVTAVSALVAAAISGLSIGVRSLLLFLTAWEKPRSETERIMRSFTVAAAVYVLMNVVLLLFAYTPALRAEWEVLREEGVALAESVKTISVAYAETLTNESASTSLEDAFAADRAIVSNIVGDGDYYTPAGLLPQVIIVAVLDGAFLLLNELITAVLTPLLSRWWGRRTAASQPMMDHFYDPPMMNISLCYALMIKTAAICLVFAPAAPAIYFISGVSLLLMCFVQKISLVKVYRRPPLLDDEIAERSREILGVLLLAHVVSSAVFYSKQAQDSGSDLSLAYSSPLIFSILAWLFYALFPFQSLIKRDVDDEATGAEQTTYSAARRANPGVMEEYRCPSTEHDVRTRDQKLDKLALKSYQLQKRVMGEGLTPWLFFDRVKELEKEQRNGCCKCCSKQSGDLL